ncbi:type 4a pilus biogenesis protein PilO [Candidatus Gottesmanbacteria bacterium]|nr:type 4a pilus biogenesis protein PilO [Candidatus Gottesmanbacteria bacterium]
MKPETVSESTSQYRRYYQRLEEFTQKPNNRMYTTTIFSFLAISLFGWYAIRPTVQTILFLQREIKDNQVVSKKMEEKISALVEAQATYQKIKPQIPLASSALPQSPEVLSLVSQLRNLANATNASLSAVQIPTVPLLGQDASQSAVPSRVSAGVGDFSITVTAVGPYTAVSEFLKGLISMRRILSIELMSLIPSRDGKSTLGNANIQLTLKLRTYYLLP